MMNAYDKSYLERARTSFGRMLDYAVYDIKYDLAEFWEMFLSSRISKQFEQGEASVLAGKSGVELALLVCGREKDYEQPRFSEGKSVEYWLGWALAYYQWRTCLTFSEITEFIGINEIKLMYSPYHEMDIRQFCDGLSEIYIERRQQTNLKRRRLAAYLSQAQLAGITGIPVRTIQQYEQGQKDINRARAEYVIALSRALYCEPRQLLEPQKEYS